MMKHSKGVPFFVVTFHHKLTFLAKKIEVLHKYLHIDLEVKTVFIPTPMVSFRCVRKIRDYLAWGKIYPLEQNGGSKKY